MSLSADQRHSLGAFLRKHREALGSEPPRPKGRRRTPGLRREEVALMSGLSTTWYTWAEQGRDIALSDMALARLAVTLRLTEAERAYVFALARRRDPAPPSAAAAPGADPDLVAALAAMAGPAYLLDRLWQVRAANPAAHRLFAPWFDSGETCLLRYVFLHATARDFICDWEDRARRLLAEFRADTAAYPGDATIQRIVANLLAESPDFGRLWNEHAVMAREGGARMFRHPLDGPLAFEQVTLVPAARPDHKLVLLLPRFV